MENVEKWFDDNSRKIMDFSDTNEEVISKEKFLEFAERQASKISSNAVLAVTEQSGVALPDAGLHHCPNCGWGCGCSDQPCSCCSGNDR